VKILSIFSWLTVLWIVNVFLSSLPYKFTLHPDTQHIFGTIGYWLQSILGDSIGNAFAHYGAYLVGSAELLVSILLLSPLMFWLARKLTALKETPPRSLIHAIGGLFASAIMAGAAFFHLFTPLGVEVLHDGKSDGGSLFYAAVSIFVLGLILSVVNFIAYKKNR